MLGSYLKPVSDCSEIDCQSLEGKDISSQVKHSASLPQLKSYSRLTSSSAAFSTAFLTAEDRRKQREKRFTLAEQSYDQMELTCENFDVTNSEVLDKVASRCKGDMEDRTREKKSLPVSGLNGITVSSNPVHKKIEAVSEIQNAEDGGVCHSSLSNTNNFYDNSSYVPDSANFTSMSNTLFKPLPQAKDRVYKIVAETNVSPPNRSRIHLRNLIMFLLISNACLWICFSLEGTVFVIYFYQYEYYSQSVWKTITVICRPLIIFFHMHSSACLFEIWSFA